MRAAPPVLAALGRGRPERMLITLLHGLAGALIAGWLVLHAELALWLWPSPAAVLAAGLAMGTLGRWIARRTLPPVPGSLCWDGQAWSLETDTQRQALQRLVVAIDLGIWVLLQLHPANERPRWRVASAGSATAQWHGLRVALAIHAGTAWQPDGEEAP